MIYLIIIAIIIAIIALTPLSTSIANAWSRRKNEEATKRSENTSKEVRITQNLASLQTFFNEGIVTERLYEPVRKQLLESNEFLFDCDITGITIFLKQLLHSYKSKLISEQQYIQYGMYALLEPNKAYPASLIIQKLQDLDVLSSLNIYSSSQISSIKKDVFKFKVHHILQPAHIQMLKAVASNNLVVSNYNIDITKTVTTFKPTGACGITMLEVIQRKNVLSVGWTNEIICKDHLGKQHHIVVSKTEDISGTLKPSETLATAIAFYALCLIAVLLFFTPLRIISLAIVVIEIWGWSKLYKKHNNTGWEAELQSIINSK